MHGQTSIKLPNIRVFAFATLQQTLACRCEINECMGMELCYQHRR